MFLKALSESLGDDDAVVTAAYQLRGYLDGNTEMAKKATRNLIQTHTFDLSLEDLKTVKIF